MRGFVVMMGLLAGAAGVSAPGVSAAGAWAAEPPVSVRRVQTDMVVAQDGSATSTVHMEIAVNTQEAARQVGQQSFQYNEGRGTIEIVQAYTLKPDGTRAVVEPDAIKTQLAPGTPNYPEFADRKQVTAVFPSVAAGDVLVFDLKRTELPPFPGYFSWWLSYVRTMAWDSASFSIATPPGMTLQTETHGPAATQEPTAEGGTVYRWTYAARAIADEKVALGPTDHAPRVFASAFPDWTSFGRAYAALIAGKADVSPAIQALADRVAAPAAGDRREEARLLYEWVSRNVRWVAIYIGNGGFEPHAADSVLAKRYGDCKDQVMLLQALLRARGIASEPVLINAGNAYTLSQVASYAMFNHLITYLPEWRVYADTTAGSAPFGTVPLPLYGKRVVHAVVDGEVLRQVPPLAPGEASWALRTTAVMDEHGVISGTTEQRGTGAAATTIRGYARSVAASGTERSAASVLRSRGIPGDGVFRLPPEAEMGPEAGLGGRFTLEAQAGWLEGDSFEPPMGLRNLPRAGNGPIGNLDQAVAPTEPTPCYAGVQTEDMALKLPPGFRPTALPRGRALTDPAFEYRSTWSFENDTLHVRRRFESRVTGPLCEGELRTRAARAMATIRGDYGARVTLERIE